MTQMTRDTRTVEPGMALFDADEYDPAESVAMLVDRNFDPTRVRLTGLRAAEWASEAACVGQSDRAVDPWHPGGDGEPGAFSAATRLTCRDCPVRAQCLALGLALLPLGDVWGMYGGYAPSELRVIARERGMAVRVTAQHGTRARRVAGCDCAPCKRAHAEYVVELRAAGRYVDSDRADVDVPVAETTETPLTDLLTLLREAS